MAHLIDKDALVAEIERRIKSVNSCPFRTAELGSEKLNEGQLNAYNVMLSLLDTLEVREVDLYNNGWIDCAKQMPPETKQTSDTLQGHREWTESDTVLAWDSTYGCRLDCTKNGKWVSEQSGGYKG